MLALVAQAVSEQRESEEQSLSARLCRENGYLDFSRGAMFHNANSKESFLAEPLTCRGNTSLAFPLDHCPSQRCSLAELLGFSVR